MLNLSKKMPGKTFRFYRLLALLLVTTFILSSSITNTARGMGKIMSDGKPPGSSSSNSISKVELLRVVPLSGVNPLEFSSLTTKIRIARQTGPGGLPHTITITSLPSPAAIDSEDSTTYTLGVTDNLAHALTFAWTASCPAIGANGTFTNAAVQNPTWTAPDNETGDTQDCTITVTIDDDTFGLTQTGSFTQSVGFPE